MSRDLTGAGPRAVNLSRQVAKRSRQSRSGFAHAAEELFTSETNFPRRQRPPIRLRVMFRSPSRSVSAPTFDAPERSDDLPAGLLEVLDFAPLVQEFYRRSGIDEQMVEYVRAYQAEGDRLRAPTTEMVRALLTYLHTRPITTSSDRVEVKNPITRRTASKRPTAFDRKNAGFLSCRICWRRLARSTFASSATITTPLFRKELIRVRRSCVALIFNTSSMRSCCDSTKTSRYDVNRSSNS